MASAAVSKVDREKSIISDVVILQRDSRNGNVYEPSAIADVVRLINAGNGHRVNLKHKQGAGEYLAGIGKVFNAIVGSDGKAYAELRLKPNGQHTQQILDDAESDDFNDDMALSIEVLNPKHFKAKTVGGKRRVSQITKMNPLALVANGGTNNGLFEEDQNLNPEEGEEMAINNVTELRAAHPDMVATIEGEARTKYAAEKEASFAAEKQPLIDRVAELEKELTETKVKLDLEAGKVKEFTDAAATDARVEEIKCKCEEKKVPAGAITEETLQLLANSSDELVEEMLDLAAAKQPTKPGYTGGTPGSGTYKTRTRSATLDVLAKHKAE